MFVTSYLDVSCGCCVSTNVDGIKTPKNGRIDSVDNLDIKVAWLGSSVASPQKNSHWGLADPGCAAVPVDHQSPRSTFSTEQVASLSDEAAGHQQRTAVRKRAVRVSKFGDRRVDGGKRMGARPFYDTAPRTYSILSSANSASFASASFFSNEPSSASSPAVSKNSRALFLLPSLI